MESPGCRSFHPGGVGMHQPPRVGVFTSLKTIETPYYWDVLYASSDRHDQLLTPFQSLSLNMGWEEWVKNSKLLVMS